MHIPLYASMTTLGTSYFFVETLLCCQLRVRFERRAGKKWRQYYNTTYYYRNKHEKSFELVGPQPTAAVKKRGQPPPMADTDKLE